MINQTENVRIDKWLWAVRIFKSRSLATTACNGGHVKIEGRPVKPSHSIRVGEEVHVYAGQVNRVLKVLGLLENRVGAALVLEYMLDMTPKEEWERVKEQRQQHVAQFPKGWGRPTKKQRRQLDAFNNEF